MPIRNHVWVYDNRDFCGKECLCDSLGHRHNPKKRYCDQCRGPQVYGTDKAPQFEVVRSRKKLDKQQKSHSRRRAAKVAR